MYLRARTRLIRYVMLIAGMILLSASPKFRVLGVKLGAFVLNARKGSWETSPGDVDKFLHCPVFTSARVVAA